MNQVALKIRPSEWTRMKWLYTALWVLLTVTQILSRTLEPPPTADPLILFTNILVATGLGGFIAHDLWKLKVRYWPLAIDILIYAVFILGFLTLISLKEAGVWNWNDTHLDVPLFVFFTVSTVAAWITENRKEVKIYIRAPTHQAISFIRSVVERGEKVDIVDTWADEKSEAIPLSGDIEVNLNEVENESFRFFENHRFSFKSLI